MIREYWPWSRWTIGRMPSPLQSWGREHYIPLKTQELIEFLIDKQRERGSDSQALERLFRQFVSLIHQQFRKHHEQLVFLYHDFDPDADVMPSQVDVPIFGSNHERDLACRKLFSEVADSLEYANYRRLKPHEIQQALNVASYWGVRLKIRCSSFRRLEVYGRGDNIAKRTKRDLSTYISTFTAFHCQSVPHPHRFRKATLRRSRSSGAEDLPPTLLACAC